MTAAGTPQKTALARVKREVSKYASSEACTYSDLRHDAPLSSGAILYQVELRDA